MNTGYCPETSKDANGYNRYYRIKVLLNVAEGIFLISTLYSAKAQRGGRSDFIITCRDKTFCFRRSFNFAHLFDCRLWGKI